MQLPKNEAKAKLYEIAMTLITYGAEKGAIIGSTSFLIDIVLESEERIKGLKLASDFLDAWKNYFKEQAEKYK